MGRHRTLTRATTAAAVVAAAADTMPPPSLLYRGPPPISSHFAAAAPGRKRKRHWCTFTATDVAAGHDSIDCGGLDCHISTLPTIKGEWVTAFGNIPPFCRRNLFLGSLLLQVRGGDLYSSGDDDFHADELLDSIFGDDVELPVPHRSHSAQRYDEKLERSMMEKALDVEQRRGEISSRQESNDISIHKKGKENDTIKRGVENDNSKAANVHNQRKKLLSDLAISLHDSHISALQSLIKGSAAHIPPALFGQTICQEKSGCSEKFHDVFSSDANNHRRETMDWSEQLQSAVFGGGDEGGMDPLVEPTFRHIEDPMLLSYWGLTPNAKLFGGAQYHRVIRYYHHLFLTVPLPPITDDEIALLTNGITETNDASDLMRAVALLVRHKMELVAEDLLMDMTRRLLYVMDRQWEMVDYSMALHRPMGSSGGLGKSGDKAIREANLYQRHGNEYTAADAELRNIMSVGYHKFAEERAADAHRKSLEDVRSLLRYITWDMGRARDMARNRGQGQGFVSRIEIVRDDPVDDDNPQQAELADEPQRKKSNMFRRRKNKDEKKAMSGGHSNFRVVKGGTAIGSGRRRSKKGDELNSRRQLQTKGGDIDLPYGEEVELDEDDNLMNGGMSDENNPSSTSLVVTSQTSPIFSGDDEVLNVLLDTVSSTLALKSDTQAGYTHNAIERLTSYVSEKMRLDMSRIIRSKFNTFFLLAFYEDLGPYLRREMDTYIAHQLGGVKDP